MKDESAPLMEEYYPFAGQRIVRPISKEEIDAFNMERFTFAQEAQAPGKAVAARPFEAVRDAAVKLLASAMGEQRATLPKIDEAVLRRYASDIDSTIW